MALAPGDSFGRYTIEAPLGAGGMGEVFRAVDGHLHRRVALKIVRADRDAKNAEDAAKRLLREARAAAAFDHPNVVSIFDVGEVDGTPYIAMELIEGAQLRAYVGNDEAPLATRIRWITDIARALAAAHKRGLVHRDIKPGNVMVRDDGVIKVLDFGIARRARLDLARGEGETLTGDLDAVEYGGSPPPSSHPLATLTGDGAVVGTPLYMAPEQMRGEEVDGRADQYAWGVVAYELLTGKRPWGNRATLSAMAENLSKDPLAMRALVPEVPERVAEVVTRALAKDKRDRHASMDAIVLLLDDMVIPPRPSVRDVESEGSTELAAAAGAGTADAPRRSTRFAIAVGALVVAAGTALGIAVARSRGPGAAPATSAGAVTPSARPVLITALPSPASTSESAIAAYRRSLEAERASDTNTVRKALLEATKLDPTMAAAWLRLAMNDIYSGQSTEAREAFGHAGALRTRLDDHDQMLLDAFEPVVQRVPIDFDEHARRLKLAVDRFPNDAEIALDYAYAALRRGKWAETVAAYDHSIALDPGQPEQFRFKALAQADLGDIDGAMATAEECEKSNPTSGICPFVKAPFSEQRGDCQAMEAEARSMALKDPDGFGYEYLANALASQGAPVSAVREALALDDARLPEDRRIIGPKERDLETAIWAGDFVRAEAIGGELATLLKGDDDEDRHALGEAFVVEMMVESGRPAEARRLAESFLARRTSWSSNRKYLARGVVTTVVPAMLAAVRAGGGSAADFEKARDAFAADWVAHMPAWQKGMLWLAAYAGPASSAGDARRALEVLSDYEPLPIVRRSTLGIANEGRVYLLAGDAARARPLLDRGSRVCVVLEHPFERVRAWLALGDAAAAMGDRPAACEAYGRVVERWGAAKPRSISADAAKSRRASLRCE